MLVLLRGSIGFGIFCINIFYLDLHGLLIKLSLTQPTSFVAFTLPILSRIPPGRSGGRERGVSEQLCGKQFHLLVLAYSNHQLL